MRARGGSERGDHVGEFIGREAIEEEVRGDRIEAIVRRWKFGQCGGLKLEAIRIRDGAGLRAGAREHSRARVDTEDFEIWKTSGGRAQEMAVPNACNHQTLARCEGIEMSDACTLKTRAGEEALHPSVVRGEDVEGHGRGFSENLGRTALGRERT